MYIFLCHICIGYIVKEVGEFSQLMGVTHKGMQAQTTDYTGNARKKAGCKNCNK